MGVTIHFEGRLRGDAAFDRCVSCISEFAVAKGWRAEEFTLENQTLCRVRNEHDWDYVGPTRGIEVQPHPCSDPLRFKFDDGLFVQEYIKTQFAPIEVHLDVVCLLEKLNSIFSWLTVEDEGEYFETKEMKRLIDHRQKIEEILAELMAGDPSMRGPVRLSHGRIADYVRV